MNQFSSWIEISKNALEHNLFNYKSIIGNAFLAPVIKSNAYGHGILQIGSICQQNPHINYLCVSLLSEALTLYNSNITKPILVLSYIDLDPREAINKSIEFVIYDYQTAIMINTIGKKHNYIFSIHLKIDTGLSRLGIIPKQVLHCIHDIQKLPFVKINGICTHFAESQKKDLTFTHNQLAQFNMVLDALKKNTTIPLIHVANSAATTALKLPYCNLFRVGIGIYGLWPSEENKKITKQQHPGFTIKPALTWKTRIIHIKKVPANQYVGYDRTYQTTKETTLATIPVGYYDGYDFRLANRGFVRIHNTYAPIIGRVSMNLTTIDISHITTQVCINDEVILLGNYPQINAYDLSYLSGNPNVREVITKINATIPRIIVE